MSSPVSYTLDDNIGVIAINYPPVNALSQAVRQGLHEAISAARTDASEAVVIVCDGRTFIAGADITEFGSRIVSSSTSSTLTPQTTPVINSRFGFIFGALAKNVSKSVSFLS